MIKKYEFTGKTKRVVTTNPATGEAVNVEVKQIRYLKDVMNHCDGTNVKEGELGGWLEDEDCLSQTGSALVGFGSVVLNGARVAGSSYISNNVYLFPGVYLQDNCCVKNACTLAGNITFSKDLGAIIEDTCRIIVLEGTELRFKERVCIQEDVRMTISSGGIVQYTHPIRITGPNVEILSRDELVAFTFDNGERIEKLTMHPDEYGYICIEDAGTNDKFGTVAEYARVYNDSAHTQVCATMKTYEEQINKTLDEIIESTKDIDDDWDPSEDEE